MGHLAVRASPLPALRKQIIVVPKIMSITFDQTCSLPEACVHWLAAQPVLSDTTAKNYRGEIDRLGQYLAAKFALRQIGDVLPQHWAKYIDATRTSRQQIARRRSDVLKASSALQAMRISRMFLMWCAQHGLIGWWPLREQVAAPADSAQLQVMELPPALQAALSGQVIPHDVEDLRAVFAINLLHWGLLNAGELTALRREHLCLQGAVLLRRAEPPGEIVLPAHVRRLWMRYGELRQKAVQTQLSPSAPLVSRIGIEGRLKPWSVWAMVKAWQERSGVVDHLSPQKLRAAYLQSIQIHEAVGLAAAAHQAGRASVRMPAAANSAQMSHMQRRALRQMTGASSDGKRRTAI
jgi:site-specific recombinase XerD